MKPMVVAALSASLVILSGCSMAAKENTVSGTSTTAASTSSSATSTPSNTTSAMSGASKESFCRDINTAVNVRESAGETLTDAQTTDMAAALETASTGTPSDVPPDFVTVINALLADLQAPTTTLPESWNPNADKLAQYAADYCG